MKAYRSILILVFLLIISWPQPAWGEDSLRLANYYLKWQIDNSTATELAKWDLLILDMQNQATSPAALQLIKEKNSDIKILAYLTVEEIQDQHQNTGVDNPWRQIYDEVNNNNLWLRTTTGAKLSVWAGTSMIDVSQVLWQTWLPDFLEQTILSQPYWDGVFLDNCFDSLSGVSGAAVSDQAWRNGLENLLANLRSRLTPNQLLVVNSSSYYADLTNGRLYEGWPTVYGNTWLANKNDYFSLADQVLAPATIIINSNTGNQYRSNDYQMMRFGLTSTLLGDGYFSFDYGDQDHAQTWWYDEYDQVLGEPLSEPINLLTDGSYGLWRRDFSQGTILINASLNAGKVKLGGEYEKIKGNQDPGINDGRVVTSVEVPSQDGLILLRRVKSFSGAVFRNGSFAKVYDASGAQTRNSFFVYDSAIAGDSKAVTIDRNNDGQLDKIVAGDNWVAIYDQQNNLVNKFFPYTEKYNQGINFTVGDLNGDGWVEIITGTERGGGPQIRIFNSEGVLINPGFFAYASNFRGGVSVAVADLNGNGQMEIVAGAGHGGGPQIRVFDQRGNLLSAGWFAFANDFRGGVTVAAADINADGHGEILATPGRGGESLIKVFDSAGQLLNSWSVAAAGNDLGLDLAITDLAADGLIDIIAMTRDVFSW